MGESQLKVLVVGGGPAGMMAAGQAAAAGASVTLLERNDRLGKKLAITGKGRGNVTNDADVEEIIAQFPGNGTFLYGPIYRFTNDDVRRFFAELGVPTVVERGGRVFPKSQKASDLVQAMERFLVKTGVRVQKGERVTRLSVAGGSVVGVKCGEKEITADAVILATGGASYPATGSTGDGYRLAEKAGHAVVKPRPALVPLEVAEKWVPELTGLALKNVSARVLVEGRLAAEEFGEMLFTHYGVSGPIILTLSREATGALNRGKKTQIQINLKPALTPQQLDARLVRDFDKYSRKQFKNSLDDLLPQKLIEPVVRLSGISGDVPVNQITKQQRIKLAETLTALTLNVTAMRPLREAIVTAGGVNVKEIDPATMESKLVKNLYFAGELIDVDGNTGGYNLQAAFSTGFVAGISAGKQE
ncbi:BaiN/RdsA family NAD(P)/FAD-dependent oxidoreductase [Dethiobacter alkaliphilus]|uniref:HI0933 family protein n=1 Tax=Dethiobacter alkaliphilus AHT 1 TaxID=555088 RepID=C0GDV5_DETAL|nr:NAD(P)/FAD-dependent oxidoreductase [Dethiobacter alkaliphilus]EEG78249.1 HI0933 family protein [Dethiobacter alkaliphilus AHT 1]